MRNKYNFSKIYKIINTETDDIYIGSTTQKYLSERLAGHRQKARNRKNKSKLYKIMRTIGIDKFHIFLIRNVKCHNREELDKQEEIERKKQNATLNTNKCHTTENEKREFRKKYYQNNREHINCIKNEKFICPVCGSQFTRTNKSHHDKSKTHRQAVKQKEIEKEIHNIDIDSEMKLLLKHHEELKAMLYNTFIDFE